MNDSNNANLKIILVQIMAIWFGSLVFMSIPFLVFARFGETVVSCSFYTLLEDNFLVGFGIINITLLWPAHICINIIYVYLFVYLRKRLRTINTAQITSKYPPKENSQRSNRVHDNALPPLETPLDIQTKPPSKVQSVSSICGGPGCSTDHAQTKCRYINVKEVGNTTTNESPSNREKESDAKVPDTALIARARGQEGTKLRCTYDNRLGLQKQRRVLVTIGILLISLNVFMTPLDFVFLIEIFNFGQLTRGVRFVFVAMAMLNSALNPVINIWRIKPFQAILKEKAMKVYEFFLRSAVTGQSCITLTYKRFKVMDSVRGRFIITVGKITE